jgi:beta-lactamase class D
MPRIVAPCCAIVVLSCALIAVASVRALPAEPPASPPATQPASAPVPRATREIDLKAQLGDYDACFVLLDLARGERLVYNPARAARRFSPCSTFKIPHALIALETGVASGPDHLRKWDGHSYWRAEMNRDQTLRSAVRDSVVWYFQQTAAEIGPARMQRFLDDFEYGNRDISAGQTQFWLGASLAISADEQIAFLDRLVRGALPCAPRTVDAVRALLVLSDENGYVLRGKTGTAGAPGVAGGNELGWFVGYVTHGDDVCLFALNLSGGENPSGGVARAKASEILKALGKL